jgi:hypothetical protein
MQTILFATAYLAIITVPITITASPSPNSDLLRRELTHPQSVCEEFSLTDGQVLFTACENGGQSGMCFYILQTGGTCVLDTFVPTVTNSGIFNSFVGSTPVAVVGTIVQGAIGFTLELSSLVTFNPSSLPSSLAVMIIFSNHFLESIQFSLKNTISQNIEVIQNAVLEEISWQHESDSLVESLTIINNPLLKRLNVNIGKLAHLQTVIVQSNGDLTSLSTTLPQSLTSFEVLSNRNLATVNIPSIPGLVTLFRLNGHPALTSFETDLAGATQLTTLDLASNALVSVDLKNIPPNLVSIDLSGNPFPAGNCPTIPATVTHYTPPTGC